MNKYLKHYEQRPDTFYLEAGRVICRNGKELFVVKLLEHETGQRYNISLVECDAIAHYVVDALNKVKTWDKYLSHYQKN